MPSLCFWFWFGGESHARTRLKRKLGAMFKPAQKDFRTSGMWLPSLPKTTAVNSSLNLSLLTKYFWDRVHLPLSNYFPSSTHRKNLWKLRLNHLQMTGARRGRLLPKITQLLDRAWTPTPGVQWLALFCLQGLLGNSSGDFPPLFIHPTFMQLWFSYAAHW